MSNMRKKFKDALNVGRSGNYFGRSLYEYLNLDDNPFRLEVDPLDLDFHVDREQIIIDFAERVGYSIQLFESDPTSTHSNFLVHGLRGTGKTFFSNFLHRIWRNWGFSDYETKFIDFKSLILVNTDSLSSSRTYDKFLSDIKSSSHTQIVIVDNIDYSITGNDFIPRLDIFLNELKEAARYGIILIGFIESLTLNKVIQAAESSLSYIHERNFLSSFHTNKFFIKSFDEKHIKSLLIKRLKKIEREFFTESSLELISLISFGNPVVALKLANECLTELINLPDVKKVNKIVTKDVAKRKGYIISYKIARLINTNQDSGNSEADLSYLLTPKRLEIILAVLNHQIQENFFFPSKNIRGLNFSELAEIIKVNTKSTMNYHIKTLTEGHPQLLEVRGHPLDARKKIYRVNMNTHISYALELFIIHKYLLLPEESKEYIPSQIIINKKEIN